MKDIKIIVDDLFKQLEDSNSGEALNNIDNEYEISIEKMFDKYFKLENGYENENYFNVRLSYIGDEDTIEVASTSGISKEELSKIIASLITKNCNK